MKLVRGTAMVLGGVFVGLGLVEAAFWLRDGGAFPHLNLYRPDPVLGVRLEPGATERISFSKNPRSSVRINAQGYRGADWPARRKDEIFIVGDSQAFGLGVEEAESFAERLGQKLGRPVANGAVPTYGPDEYDAVLAEELPRRRPKTVVYTINLANDLFELAHPNTERHAVWDGWAVRKETAPAQSSSFPGRSLLFRQSHAFFAARGLWWKLGGDTDEGATASEGTWRDLVTQAKASTDEQSARKSTVDADRARRDAAVRGKQAEMRKLDGELGELMQKTLPDQEVGASTLRTARANPGDIVRVFYGEGSRPVPAIAEQINQAIEARKQFEAKLKELGDKQGLAALDRRDALDQGMRALMTAPAEVIRASSPLRPHLEKAKALCEAAGAELVVLVLPLDVQVSGAEWKKYGAEARDLSASRVLVEDIVAIAEELGLRSVDAWPALAAAEPGAFLDGDLHMTPKGHQAVADAIARTLAATVRLRPQVAALPLGRSAVPPPSAWTAAGDVPRDYGAAEPDLKRLGCKADMLSEWLRLRCADATMALSSRTRATERSLIMNRADGSTLITPLIEGSQLGVDVWRRTGKERRGYIRAEWALGEASPYLSAYGESLSRPSLPAAPEPSADERALCACHQSTTSAKDCAALYGQADAECMQTYTGDCASLLRCARGDRNTPPACPGGQLASGVIPRCPVPAAPMNTLTKTLAK